MRFEGRVRQLLVCLFCIQASVWAQANSATRTVGSQARARSLLHTAFLVSGGGLWHRLQRVEMTGDLSLGGMSGTFRQTVDLKSGRDATTIDAGPLHIKQVSLRDSSWQIDRSGVVTYADTPDARQDAITQSFIDRNRWFTEGGRDATYAGSRSEGGQTYQLVSVSPAGGRKLTLWFGGEDHLLHRIEQIDASHQQSILFLSDYRKSDGVLFPYLVRQSNGSVDQDTVETVKTLTVSEHVEEQPFTAPRSDFSDAALAGGGDSAVVPFEIADGRICVQVSIEGHVALPFLIDSGASNYVTPLAAKTLGLKGSGDFALSGTGQGQESGQLTHVTSLKLGPVELKDQQFGVGPLPSFLQDRGGRPAIAGLLGAELLRRFPTTFDYQHRTLTFHRPGTVVTPPSHSVTIPLQFNDGHPFIKLRVDGSTGDFGIDTGDSGGITMFGSFYDEHRFPIETPGQIKQQGGIGGKTSALLTRVSSVRLGDATLHHPLVTLNTASHGLFSVEGIAGNLGYEFLKNFVLTMDYERRIAYVEPSSDFGKEAAYNRSGLGLGREKDGSLLISRVNPDTPAARAGLKAGDRIVRMNGADPQTTAGEVFDQMLSGAAGSQVSVAVLQNGLEQDLTITLEELLPEHGTMRPRTDLPISLSVHRS